MSSTDSFFLNSLRSRVKKNGNALIGIVGQKGSGKSYFAMSIAEIIDPKFSVNNISFDPVSFMQLIKMRGVGEVIIMDDAGLTIPARQFYSKSNQFITVALETCRFKNQILIMTMPTLSMIDKNARLLMDYSFWTRSIDRVEEKSTATMYFISSNPNSGKIYFKHPTSGNSVFKTLTLPKPSEWITNEYETHKQECLNTIYDDMIKDLIQMRGKTVQDEELTDEKIRQMRKEGCSLYRIGKVTGKSANYINARCNR